MQIVNKNILKHPLNWLTLWSMALLAFYVGHLLLSAINGEHPGAVSGSTSEGIAGPGTDVSESLGSSTV